MEKISNLISKKVISIEEGLLVGYVLNIILSDNLKFFDGLVIVDRESEKTFFLERKNIIAQGDDCIMIGSSNYLQISMLPESNNPIGKIVYDCFGNMLGRIIEIEVEGRVIKKVITNKCEFFSRFVGKIGYDFVILCSSKKKKKKFDLKKQIGGAIEDLPIVKVEEIKSIELDNPQRLFANPNSLMGKMVMADILGLNNELIAKKFDVIDKTILDKARIHNKTNILAFYSK